MISAVPKIPGIRQGNKAEAAEFFDVGLATIDGWIRRGAPIVQKGRKGVSWVIDLREMAEWKYGGKLANAETTDPEDMSPKDRLDWYKGNRERDAHAKDTDNLVPFDIMEDIVGAAFAAVKTSLLAQHNTIASEYPEIPIDAIKGIQRSNKEILSALAETKFPESIEVALGQIK